MKHGYRVLIGALATAVLAVTVVLLAAGGESVLAGGGIIYVDVDATGRDDGTTWRHAYTDLQRALDAEAGPLDQIWVAAGTYKPSHEFIPGDPRSASFQMVNGVAIYGGFDPGAGVTKFEDRDWVAYETILSGDLGTAGDPSDNSYHVWYNPLDISLDDSAIVDGFTITAGNADLVEYPHGLCGGGVFSEGLSPNWRNITFLNNSAEYGGALWVSEGYPKAGRVTLTNVTFVGNLAIEGGAVFIDGTEAVPGETGGVTFTNCMFRDNAAELGGGVAIIWGDVDADTPQFRFTNCTIYGNEAELGGAFYVGEGPGEGWLAVTNSIMWGDIPDEVYTEDPEHPLLVTYSDVAGDILYPGIGNIKAAPEFLSPEEGDLHLQPGSPCIDVGNNDAPNLPMDDYEGDPRLGDGDGDGYAVVDMGADEVRYPYPVEISVTPYIPTNVIRMRPGVVVDVAILSTADFDAVAQVAPDMVEFAGATHVGFTFVDVNNDGHDDVLLDFLAQNMVDLDKDSTEATLTGFTLEGVPIEGTDEVKVR